MGVFLAADAALTAIAGYKLASAGKSVNGKPAAVIAALALCHGSIILEGAELFVGKHLSLIALLKTFSGNKRSAESSHDACNIRADGLAVSDFLKASEYGIIIEGTALYHNVSAKLGGIGYFDYLEQCIFDHGISQSGGDVGDTCAFLLGLFHSGIHEYGTAGAKVYGVFGKNGGSGKIFHTVIQGLCKRFNKGTAAGGTGFV